MLVYNDVKRQFVLDVKDNSIEYNIPLTSKRVDFIIAGADEQGNENVVIVELKQWQKADVRRIVPHPSYQALREYLKRCIKN